MSIRDTALKFVDACDTGKGWDVCSEWCHDGAGFSCQAGALSDADSLAAYVGWAAGLLGPVPDARYELKCVAVDEERSKVAVQAVFQGTNTGEGPVPPTGNAIASDYVYVMEFDGDRIRHMTKIWNDGHALGQLGWA